MLEAAGLDLLDLVSRVTPLRKASNTDGGEYVGACPDCGGTDRFHVWPNAERPHWRCGLPGRNGCGRGGDLIQWLIDFGGLGFPEAARAAGKALVDHRPVRPVRPPSPPAPRLPPDTDPPPPAWQARARAIAARAAEVLWSPDGAAALRYLREERGLSDATIQAAGLGYVPVEVYDPPYKWGLTGKRVYVPPGITIPVEAHGALWALKVRRLDGSIPRYIQPRDGKVALYGADQLQGRALCVLTEGEFDALLLRQEAGDLVDVATLGSATALPTPRWAWALRHAGVWLVAYDRDAAGAKGGARMAALSRRVRIVQPFSGKDLTAMVRAGGDLRAWATGLVARYTPLSPRAVVPPPASSPAPSASPAPPCLCVQCERRPAGPHRQFICDLCDAANQSRFGRPAMPEHPPGVASKR